jgi:hypothetical protein
MVRAHHAHHSFQPGALVKYISPSLLAIAAFAAAPCAQALSVKDDDVKLGINLVIQARADISDATFDGGADAAPIEGNDIPSDSVDFYLRRARFGLKGTWKDDYTFAFIMRADGAGKTGPVSSSASVAFYEATIGRKFKTEGSDLVHSIEFGYMAPTYNTASNVHSSSSFLLANEASTAAVLTNRNAGIKYHLSAPWVNLFVDVMNNAGDDAANNGEGAAATDKSGEGLWTSARVHISPEGEWKIEKPQESWAGKEGKGVLVGLDVAQNSKDNTSNTESRDAMGYGIDAVVHFDGLSALVEYRVAEYETEIAGGGGTDWEASAWRVQVGYAFPMGDTFVEPAVRFSSYDANDQVDSTEEFFDHDGGSGGPSDGQDYGASGDQIDLGVNWYIHEHKNKLQLAYTMWEAEDGDAEASILRAQWQLSF